MTEQRKGEIAYKLVKHLLRQRGLTLKPELRRELGDVAKKIDVPVEELAGFLMPIARELGEEVFGSFEK